MNQDQLKLLISDLLSDPTPENQAIANDMMMGLGQEANQGDVRAFDQSMSESMQPQFNQTDTQRNIEQFAREDLRAFDRGMQKPAPAEPAAPVAEPELPQNYFRNERTGKVTDMGLSQPQGGKYAGMLDYSRPPVEVGGEKAYYLKGGDPLTAVNPNTGAIIRMGQDSKASMAREKEQLTLEKMRRELSPSSPLDQARAKVLADVEGEKLKAKIPGTAEYDRVTKEQSLLKKGEESYKSSLENVGKLQGFLNKAIEQTDWNTAGIMGQALSNFGGTDATNLESTLDSIKANVGFDQLQQMRRESPTGGALGQVAVKELEFLQAVEGSLKQKQSPAQLKENLKAILESAQRLEEDLKANPPNWTGGAVNRQGTIASATTVTLPNGRVMNFPSGAAAEAFKREAGIQ